MAKEREVMILDVNKGEVAKRLRDLKAKHVGVHKYKRMEFLLKGDVHGSHSWGRVRTDGKVTTITIKELHRGKSFIPTDEYEVETNDFNGTVRIIRRLINSGIVLYFENERDAYTLGNAHITIDKWPQIPHFVEIEAPSMKEVKGAYKLLKIHGKLAANTPIHTLYKSYGLDFRKVMAKNDNKLKKLTKG